MPTAEFRFYEELNDYLPSPRRKRAFALRHCVLCARQLPTELKALALVVKVIDRVDSGGPPW